MPAEYFFLNTGKYEDEKAFGEAYGALSSWRREKTDRMRTQNGRLLSLGAGILADRVFKMHGLDPEQVRIVYGEYGKPYVEDHPEFSFSLSHSGQMAMCSCSGSSTGCDIQIVNERRLSAAGKLFSAEEREIFESLEKSARTAFFYRVWTLKESLIKADGRGLSIPLDSFTVMKDAGAGREFICFNGVNYRLREITVPPELTAASGPVKYSAALCEEAV